MNSPFLTHFREIGWNHANITPDKHELFQHENIEILKHLSSENCLNHNRPVRTADEKKEWDKNYGKKRRAEQKDRERQRVAEWRAKNPEKYTAQVRRSVEKQRSKKNLE